MPAGIPRRPTGEAVPLSFAQQRVWFLEPLDPRSPAYNMSAALLFKGSLDRPAFHRAFAEIVRRHEVLRTTFEAVEGVPFQLVQPDPRVALPLVDLAALPPGQREAALQQLAREEARYPFDLAR